MWRLIRKNSLMFLLYQGLYFGLFFPLINRDRLLGENPLDLSFLLFLNTYMIWLILGSVWGQEQMESKSNGYAFLSTLPIRGRQIVGAKYALVFMATLTFVGVHLIWYAVSFDDPEFLAAGNTSLIRVASVCLPLAGLYYLGFFRFGYKRFSNYAIAFWFLMIISPLALQIVLKERFGIRSSDIFLSINRFDPVIMLSVGLLLYLGTWRLAIRFKENLKITE
ncbi:MAG: ABC-2 transporter permease [Candidatus Aminicenantaceae bacterium]